VGLKFGTVNQVDATKGLVRVQFADNENLVSWWLHVLAANTQDNKFYAMPDVGEGVACLVDEHCENGVVLGAVYSQVDGTPVQDSNKFHMRFKDGTQLEYDREQHKLTGQVQGSVELTATGDITASTDQVLNLQAGELVAIRTPRLLIGPFRANESCYATCNVDWELIGRLIHKGEYDHTGDQIATGEIELTGDMTATGTIMDQTGNSNHHVHP
jgi:phage baseplate assembly protein V